MATMIQLFPPKDGSPPATTPAQLAPDGHPTVVMVFRRALAYGTIAGSTLMAGTLMGTPYPPPPVAWYLVAALALFTFFFALCHSLAHLMHLSPHSTATHRHFVYALVVLTLIGVASLVANLLWACLFHTGHLPTRHAAVALTTHGLLSFVYGLHLIRRQRLGQARLVRHELLWPAVLTFAVSLYLGLNITNIQASVLPSVPLLMFGAYLLASEIFSFTKTFLVTSSLVLVTIITLASPLLRNSYPLVTVPLANAWSSFFFSLTVAAYLAVFDVWRLTAHVVSPATKQLPPDVIVSVALPDSFEGKYYMAALTVLTSSILLIPWFYAFENVGILFLVTFFVHGLVSLYWWIAKGSTVGGLTKGNWTHARNYFAVVGVGLLLIDAWFPFDIRINFLPDYLVGIFCAGSTAAVIGYTGTKLTNDRFYKLFTIGPAGLRPLMRFPFNAVRLLAYFSLIGLILAAIVRGVARNLLGADAPLTLKGDALVCAYTLYIGVAALSEFIRGKSPSAVAVQNATLILIAALTTTRLLTAIMVSLILFIPGIYAGRQWLDVLQLALPIMCAAMGGFALNDLHDVERDAVNRPRRVLPTNRLSRGAVRILAHTLLTAAIAAALMVSSNILEFTLYGGTIVGVVAYNWVVRRMAVVKWLLVALVATLPVVLSILQFKLGSHRSWVAAAALLFVAGREILMDVLDIPGDESVGITTLASQMGARRAALLAVVLQLAGVVCLVAMALVMRSAALSVVALCLLLLVVAITSSWFMRGATGRWVVFASWLPIVGGIVCLIL